MHFSSQKNRIYFNEKEFATETWHLAEDSLAAVLKCFIRVSPEWWPEHLCLTLEQSSDWSPHPKVHTGAPPFSLLSLSLISSFPKPSLHWGKHSKLLTDEGVRKSSEDSFDRENIILIASVSMKKISTDVTQFHSCRRAELMSTGLAVAFIF